MPTKTPQPVWKRRTIRKYHLQSDIFNQKPSKLNTINKTHYYDSDIFHIKEDKNKLPKRTIKTGRCFLESEPEKEKPPSKKIIIELYKETTQDEWKTNRIKPEKRKACEDNTLAYDLTNAKPKIERAKKRRIVSPGKNIKERRGKKIYPDKLKEHPRNTLAYH